MRGITLLTLCLMFTFGGSTMAGDVDRDKLKEYPNMENTPFNQGTSGNAWEGAKDTYRKLTGEEAENMNVPMPQGISIEKEK